jgi:membrane fusion protein (multidrug efflux system)
MNKTLKRILYAILILVVVFIIIYPKLDFSNDSDGAPAQNSGAQSSTLTVSGLVASKEKIDFSIKITGTIIADESVELKSEVSAKVDKIHFREGQQIKKGQLLVSLNDDEISAELTKLQYTKKLNEENEYRQRQLLEREAISKEEYDIALTTLNTSEADIRLLQVRQAKHDIRAPFDGVIGLRQVSVGSYINPGETITNLYKINPVKLDFSVPGRYLPDVNLGDKIRFTVDAYEQEFEGEIYAIEPQIDPQSRSVNLRGVSPNPDGKLLPGQFARISLILDTYDEAIMIPNEAVVPELNGKKVWVVENGKVSTKAVTTGIRNERNIQVLEGLNSGDTVITTGLLQIRQGMDINVQL